MESASPEKPMGTESNELTLTDDAGLADSPKKTESDGDTLHVCTSLEHLKASPAEEESTGTVVLYSSGQVGKVKEEQSTRRTEYYEDAFATRGSSTSARAKAHKESVVVVSLNTNVTIEEEDAALAEISAFLSSRYRQARCSVMLQIHHSSALIFEGSYAPAFLLRINALAALLQEVSNKRNSALIQEYLGKRLNVCQDRGVILFQDVSEANFAVGGVTVLGKIRGQRPRAPKALRNPLGAQLNLTSRIRNSFRNSKLENKNKKRSVGVELAAPEPAPTADVPTTPTKAHSRLSSLSEESAVEPASPLSLNSPFRRLLINIGAHQMEKELRAAKAGAGAGAGTTLPVPTPMPKYIPERSAALNAQAQGVQRQPRKKPSFQENLRKALHLGAHVDKDGCLHG